MSLDRLVNRVGKEYDLGEEQMAGLSRNRIAAEARSVIGYLSIEMRIATLTEVAKRFGRDITILSKGVQRIGTRAKKSEAESRRLLGLVR